MRSSWLRVGAVFYQSKLRLLPSERLLPQRVEYRPVVPDAQQLVGRRNPVRVGVLRIPEDGVGQPDQADHIAERIRSKRKDKEGKMKRERLQVGFYNFSKFI